MTATKYIPHIQGPSIALVSETLKLSRYSSINAHSNPSQLAAKTDIVADAPNYSAKKAAEEIRYAMGYGMPFESNGKTVDTAHNYYCTNSLIVHRLMRCGQTGMGNYYVGQEASMPEGRHFIFSNLMDETVACVRYTGWDTETSRILDLLSERTKPENDRERVIRRFAQFMTENQTDSFDPKSILHLYEKLYSDVRHDDSAFEETQDDSYCNNVLSILSDIVSNAKESNHPPIIQAIIVLQAVLALRPFNNGNVFMSRLMFSLALRQTGYPIAAFLPIVEFLAQWQGGDLDENSVFIPRIPFDQSVQTQGWHRDWTPWVEEVLGFMQADLDRITYKLFKLFLRRMRIQKLLTGVTWMNERQQEIVLEAMLHVDAEFTYSSIAKQFGVAYGTAYADLGTLKDEGFLTTETIGTTSVFVANDSIEERVHGMLKSLTPDQYARVYSDDGGLASEYLDKRQKTLKLMEQNDLPGSAPAFPVYILDGVGKIATEFLH